MPMTPEFEAHLKSGHTTLCRAWDLTRADGTVYGFTDHDYDLSFGGILYTAETGLAATAVQQATGLAIDNSDAVGVLSDAAMTDEDIDAGRFDGAVVRAWLVNWTDVAQRLLQFTGTIGEITRGAGAFTAELRGLTEQLNQPMGRVYQSSDSVVIGDAASGFDITKPGFSFEGALETVAEGKVFIFASLSGFEDRWFENGRAEVLTGAAAGLVGWIKTDRITKDGRRVELWENLRAPAQSGDLIRFEAGYDGRLESCADKFGNVLNFRGFPHIPGADWQMAYPRSGQVLDGGSLNE